MNITNLKVKGGNFAMVLNGTIADGKLQDVVDAGISYLAERGALSKVFKGVKDRKTVAFSADTAKVVEGKMIEGLKDITPDIKVVVTAREWSEGAGGAQAKAQAAYDEMLVLGMSTDNALKVALKVHAGFTVSTPVTVVAEAVEADEVAAEG